jgi:hypothetical protein
VDANNHAYKTVAGVLFNKGLTMLVCYPAGLAACEYEIPGSVLAISDFAFAGCTNLTNIIMIKDSIISIGYAAFQSVSALHDVSLPDGLTEIQNSAFQTCFGLTNITIPGSVTNIGFEAFGGCENLTSVFFGGNAPSIDFTGIYNIFDGDDNVTAYYLSGTTGWGDFGQNSGAGQTVLWNPQMQTSPESLDLQQKRFGFNISGTTNIPIVVEACTNVSNPIWVPLLTCTLTNGSVDFGDSQWTNYPGRFYRIRSP